ncbi:uncharacterized protein LOC133534087 [Cydia pomonella]|uniref:uncharacterized protein LOC133534087 n=1 Tax=Cydia pomonella TaxID=82600 RepID=UPI002ADD5EDB|nr:uncharacterized protein LOC133534087 [Cydia pomonella]
MIIPTEQEHTERHLAILKEIQDAFNSLQTLENVDEEGDGTISEKDKEILQRSLGSEAIKNIEKLEKECVPSDGGVAAGSGSGLPAMLESESNLPVCQRQYPFAPPIMKQLEDEIDDMLANDIIEPSNSSWRSPVLLIPLDDLSKEKTAFGLAGKGLFQFKVMPFGLCNASQTQQRLMDKLLPPEHEGKIFTYLDDIVISSSTFEEHLASLRWNVTYP